MVSVDVERLSANLADALLNWSREHGLAVHPHSIRKDLDVAVKFDGGLWTLTGHDEVITVAGSDEAHAAKVLRRLLRKSL